MNQEQLEYGIREIVERQRRYFFAGETLQIAKRKEYLAKLESALIMHKEDVLGALYEDFKKPALEAYLAEYYFLLQEIRLIRKSIKKWLKPKRVSNPIYFQPCRSEISLEAYGVVLVFAPWNYPIQLALAPILSAIAAGNTVILKPSEIAKSSEALLIKLIKQVFPSELVHVQTGDSNVASLLLQERVDCIFFTGSTAVGKIVATKAAQNLIPCILELGGKCPCIVDESADLKLAAGRILAGKLFNGGQTCFAPDFVIVHENVKVALIDALVEELKQVPWADEMAHIINLFHYERLARFLVNLNDDQLIVFGEDDEKSLKIAPRIVTDVDWDHQLLKDEIFGPILPVIGYHSTDHLLEKLSSYGDPLALYLFSEDDSFCKKIQKSKRSGGVCINDTMKQSSHLGLPFGGVGESGNGRYRGEFGVKAFSYQRAIVRRGKLGAKWMDLKPPYSKLFPWFERFMR